MSSSPRDRELANRLDEACRWFAAEWREGRQPRIERILEGFEDSVRPILLRALLGVELSWLRKSSPSVDQYLQRFPDDKPLVLEAFLVAMSVEAESEPDLTAARRPLASEPSGSFGGNPQLARWVDELCDRFSAAWNAGSPPRIEDFVASARDATRRRVLLRELLLVELEFRRRAAEPIAMEDYLARFPDDQRVVREVLRTSWDETLGDAALQPTVSTPAGGNPHFAETLDVVEGNSRRGEVAARNAEQPDPPVFGDYELLERIAHGGMGVIYKARQRRLNRTVALKMILAGELASSEEIRRFYVEAEAAARLDHPGIVPVYEVGQVGNQHFYSMAFVEGDSLAAPLKTGRYPARLAAGIMAQVAEAIHYAHQRGVIHRDLKPQNVLIDSLGRPRVTDFGLARNVAIDSTITASGQVMGTPSYMPPEQALGRLDAIGPASDVYSLGATLYHLMTGQVPFRAETPMDTLLLVLQREPVPPRQLQRDIPRDLETICLKCLQKSPAERYSSAAELSADLKRFLSNEPIRARRVTRVERTAKWARRHPAIAGLLAACVLAIAGYALVALYLYQSNPDRMRAVADRESAEAARLAAEADRLEKQKQKSAADAENRRLELQREAQKNLDVRGAWAQLVLDLKAIDERHVRTETRVVQPQQRNRFGQAPGFDPSYPLGRAHDPWNDSFDPLSRFRQPDSFGGVPGHDLDGFSAGPFDSRTGRMNEFDPHTGRWRSRDRDPEVQVDRYIMITEAYQNAILDALSDALQSLHSDERRAVFWRQYVAPNRQKHFQHVLATEQFKELDAKYGEGSNAALPSRNQ